MSAAKAPAWGSIRNVASRMIFNIGTSDAKKPPGETIRPDGLAGKVRSIHKRVRGGRPCAHGANSGAP